MEITKQLDNTRKKTKEESEMQKGCIRVLKFEQNPERQKFWSLLESKPPAAAWLSRKDMSVNPEFCKRFYTQVRGRKIALAIDKGDGRGEAGIVLG